MKKLIVLCCSAGLLLAAGCSDNKEAPEAVGKKYMEQRFAGADANLTDLNYTVVDAGDDVATIMIEGSVTYKEQIYLEKKKDGNWFVTEEAPEAEPLMADEAAPAPEATPAPEVDAVHEAAAVAHGEETHDAAAEPVKEVHAAPAPAEEEAHATPAHASAKEEAHGTVALAKEDAHAASPVKEEAHGAVAPAKEDAHAASPVKEHAHGAAALAKEEAPATH